jgi:hypothetical protein
MLVALNQATRIEAWDAEKGPRYRCPNCGSEVVLRKGRIVAHHFAHKPPVTCSWARGETQAHLAAKKLLRDIFARRGLRTEVEYEVLSSGGDRRADVLVWARNGTRVAFEVQNQPLDFGAIERRTLAYMAAQVPVIWVGLIKAEAIASAEKTPVGCVISKYTVRPWEKWAHAYSMGSLWFIEPDSEQLWQGTLKEHLIEVPSSLWYSTSGEEQSAGGYTRHSKKWRTLHLKGPIAPNAVSIKRFVRQRWSSKSFTVPGGSAARLSAG